MEMFWKCWYFITVFGSMVQGSLVLDGSQVNFLQMDNLVATILTSCYSDPHAVVIYDISDSNLAKILQTSKVVPAIVYNGFNIYRQYFEDRLVDEHYPQKVNFIIISFESSESSFEQALLIHDNIPWWNHMAVFIILDRSIGACKFARKTLQKAWNEDILTSVFLCYDSNQRLKIFTYNPFTNHAPAPWKPAEQVDVTKHHQWTLYHRIYHNQGVDICKNFDFDRTKNLDGYQFKARICISNKKAFPSINISATTNLTNGIYTVPHMAETALNIDFSYLYYYINLSDISKGTAYDNKHSVDFNFCGAPLWELASRTFHFYPAIEYESVIVTRNRGFNTPLENIANFYGSFILMMTIIILIITFCVIIISQKNKNMSFAVFEIVRLLQNSGLVSKISTLPARIFFLMIFIYFLVLHATFSGHLSSFLTKQELRKCPETIDDLKDSYIKSIYVPYTLEDNIWDPKIKKKIVITEDLTCDKLTSDNDNFDACITLKPIIINFVESKNLRLSQNPVTRSKFSYFSRDNWPLNNRMNNFMMWLAQSHLSFLHVNYFMESIEAHFKRKTMQQQKKYRPIQIKDLMFAFYFLIAGLSLATIIFLIEILGNKQKEKKRKRRLVKVRRYDSHQI